MEILWKEECFDYFFVFLRLVVLKIDSIKTFVLQLKKVKGGGHFIFLLGEKEFLGRFYTGFIHKNKNITQLWLAISLSTIFLNHFQQKQPQWHTKQPSGGKKVEASFIKKSRKIS